MSGLAPLTDATFDRAITRARDVTQQLLALSDEIGSLNSDGRPGGAKAPTVRPVAVRDVLGLVGGQYGVNEHTAGFSATSPPRPYCDTHGAPPAKGDKDTYYPQIGIDVLRPTVEPVNEEATERPPGDAASAHPPGPLHEPARSPDEDVDDAIAAVSECHTTFVRTSLTTTTVSRVVHATYGKPLLCEHMSSSPSQRFEDSLLDTVQDTESSSPEPRADADSPLNMHSFEVGSLPTLACSPTRACPPVPCLSDVPKAVYEKSVDIHIASLDTLKVQYDTTAMLSSRSAASSSCELVRESCGNSTASLASHSQSTSAVPEVTEQLEVADGEPVDPTGRTGLELRWDDFLSSIKPSSPRENSASPTSVTSLYSGYRRYVESVQRSLQVNVLLSEEANLQSQPPSESPIKACPDSPPKAAPGNPKAAPGPSARPAPPRRAMAREPHEGSRLARRVTQPPGFAARQ